MKVAPDPTADAVASAWARVSVLLRRGDQEAARDAAIQASAITGWYRRFGSQLNIGEVAIYDTVWVPVGWMWAEPARRRTLVATRVVRQYGMSIQMFEFAAVCLRMSEPGFRWFDVDAWGELEAINRRRNGLD